MTNVQSSIEDENSQMEKPNQHAVLGKLLYKFAWAFEIFAIIIGIMIALGQGIASFTEMESYKGGEMGFGGWINIFIAALPFLMVALVEATKIPFTEAFYYSRSTIWKAGFGISLIFIAFITFESALNGFERNFSALMYSIDALKKQLIATEEQMVPLEEQKASLLELTQESIESQYAERHRQISAERSDQARIVQGRIDQIRASQETAYTDSLKQRISDKREQISEVRSRLQEELDRLGEENQVAIGQISQEVSTQRRQAQQELRQARDDLQRQQQISISLIDDASFLTVSRVKKEEEAKIAEKQARVDAIQTRLNGISQTAATAKARETYNNNIAQTRQAYSEEIARLESEMQALSDELSKSLGAREADIASTVDGYTNELATIEQRFLQQQQKIEELRDKDLERLSNNTELVAELDAELLVLKKRRVELRDQINIKVGDNQIYRMAQWFYGAESAADLERDQVMTIAGIWFGSLATLIAFTGILLALASCVMRDQSTSAPKQRIQLRPQVYALLRSARRYFAYARRQRRKPIIKEVAKEVIKEVPVNKVVKTEVPVEIVKREIVHIPFYTNDENLIKKASNEQVKASNG